MTSTYKLPRTEDGDVYLDGVVHNIRNGRFKDVGWFEFWQNDVEAREILEALIANARAETVEACAKEVAGLEVLWPNMTVKDAEQRMVGASTMQDAAVTAIRARGETGK